MGLLTDGLLLSYVESKEEEEDESILRSGWPDLPVMDYWPNGSMNKQRLLPNGSLHSYQPCCLQDLMTAVKVLLHGLGEDVTRDGLLKTPLRVARSFLFATSGYRQVAEDIIGDAMFAEVGLQGGSGCGGGSGGMVVVRNIDLFSLCQACLLPFKVCCHVGYIPDGQQVVGLSKLSRVAEMFARRLQTPQRLAREIAQVLADTIKPQGVAIVLQCWHPQLPGICDHNIVSDASSEQHRYWQPYSVRTGNGQFEDNGSHAWHEFLGLLFLDGIVVNNLQTFLQDGIAKEGWCHCVLDNKHAFPGNGAVPLLPESTCNSLPKNNSEDSLLQSSAFIPGEAEARVKIMITAVESILIAISEGLKREELHLTSKRFVYFLLHFDFRAQGMNVHSDSFEADSSVIGVNGCGSGILFNEGLQVGSIGSEEGRNHPLLVLTIPFFSQCEHHLLPFHGVVHIGYFATETERPLKRSTLQMLVQAFSRRLQVQERLTKQIAEVTVSHYSIQSVIVVLEASHICMISRGVEKLGSNTATVSVTGRFATDISAKLFFLQKVATRDVKGNWT